ncbi:hypothetical protein EES37_29890 [Streptomyces sp. ADI91-18]|nr:hypothetical protein EES37_29890 [Streptomyces sp. ADI91-18]
MSNRLRPVLGSVARERGRDGALPLCRRVRAENSGGARAPDGEGGGALTRRGGHRGSTVTEAVRDVLEAEGPTYTALRPVPSRQLPAEVSQ